MADDIRKRSPLRSSLKKAQSENNFATSADDDGEENPLMSSVRRRESRVSIGHVDIEEVSVLEEDRTLQYIVGPETMEEFVFVSVFRKEGASAPAVAPSPIGLGWECTWGAKEELTIVRFTELVTEAYVSVLESQRAEWKRQRSSVLTSIQQEPRSFVREGSFKILSVTMSGEELDAWEELPIDLPDGSLVICHADVQKYTTPAGICVVCCALQ